MLQLTEIEIYQVYKSLGIDINQSPNEDGWVQVLARYRNEKNPSLGVHLPTGNFIDHGTGDKGNIEQITMTAMNCDYNSALSHIKGVIGRDPFNNFAGTGSTTFSLPSFSSPKNSPKSFWEDDENKELKIKAKEAFESDPDHPVVRNLTEYDGIEFNTLKTFDCGITEQFGSSFAMIPHKYGAQLYRRDNNDEKVIRNLPGTDTKSGFFGMNLVKGEKRLHILKSPREAMLAWQHTQDDVIGLCGGESQQLSQSLQDYLEQIADDGVTEIYTYLDCDNKDACKIAENFAANIAMCLAGTSIDVHLVNIHQISGGKAKDLTDWMNAGKSIDFLQRKATKVRDYVKFWEQKSNGKMAIWHTKIIEHWASDGFIKIYFDNEPICIKKEGGIISRINQSILIDSTKETIKSIPDPYFESSDPEVLRDNLLEAFYRNHNSYTSKSNQLLLDKGKVKFFTDSSDSVYLPYNNAMVKITSSSMEEVSYNDIDGVIWKDQIIERTFFRNPHSGSDSYFAQFINKVADGSKEREEALKSCIGYLISTHKDKANARAVIFVDEKIVSDDQDAQGRTGKSLVTKALRHVRNTHIQPGKNYNPGHTFAYQNLDIGHQIFVIDDVRSRFDFEGLFNTITDDLIIEDKYESPVIVPFDISPKIVVTTNTAITGTGPSYEGRQNVVEFSNYFSDSHDIRAEFGHIFFDDWDEEEWLRFDNFMVDCVQFFLKHGLKSYAKNYKRKQLLLSVEPNVIDFYETHLLIGKEYNKKDLFQKFQLHFENSKYKFSQPTFTTQLKKCGDFDIDKVSEIAERKSGKHRYIRFIPTKEYEEEARKKIDMEPDIFGGADF